MAAALGARLVGALAADGMGAVLLAEGEPWPALAALWEASAAWRELEAPYDAARTRVLIGLAHRHRPDQPGDRRAPGNQREDRRPPPEQHLHQAGALHPCRGDGVRLPARTRPAVYIE
jgi:hypothetical protein